MKFYTITKNGHKVLFANNRGPKDKLDALLWREVTQKRFPGSVVKAFENVVVSEEIKP